MFAWERIHLINVDSYLAMYNSTTLGKSASPSRRQEYVIETSKMIHYQYYPKSNQHNRSSKIKAAAFSPTVIATLAVFEARLLGRILISAHLKPSTHEQPTADP